MNKINKLYQKHREIINYLIFGLLTTIIGLVTYYSLTYTVLNPDVSIELQIANIISWCCSVLFAYITNKKYVFDSKNANIIKEISSFIASRVLTLIMDMIIMFISVTIFHGNDKIFKLISQVIVIISNYIFSKLFVFKKI